MRNTLIALLLLLPTLAFAAPKEFAGTWQIQLSAEDTAQIEALKKQAEVKGDTGDSLAKAMLKAVLMAAETKIIIAEDTFTVQMGEVTEVAKYTSTGEKGAWTLVTTNSEGEEATFKVSLADNKLTLDDGKKPQSFRKIQ